MVTDETVRAAERAFCEAFGRDYDAYRGYFHEAIRAALTAVEGAMWRPINEMPHDDRMKLIIGPWEPTAFVVWQTGDYRPTLFRPISGPPAPK